MYKFLLKKELWIGLIAILAVGFIEYKIYNWGYSSAETKHIKEISEINRKSAEVLKKQIDEHNKFVEDQNKAIKDLEEKNEKLDAIIKENAREASKDPNAKRTSLGKSSVMRLNRIR